MLTSRGILSVSRLTPLLLVLLALLILAPLALAGPTVTVRVEGESSTLLPATTVTLGAPDPLNNCPADSAAAAINLATAGNWDHKTFVETLLGETHSFSHNDTWAEWIDDKWGGGICNDILHEGDEVLMVADTEPPPSYAATVLPLVLSEVPAVLQAGSPLAVKVSIVRLPAGEVPPGSGTLEPAAGVNVSLGEAHAVSAADGVATLTPTASGVSTLRASSPGDAPSRTFTVCVHNGNDGNCGTSATTGAGASSTPTAGGVSGVKAATPYRGPFALVARASGLRDGGVYRHGRAPRVLAGTVLAHSAVSGVSLELRRSHAGRCEAYDGVSESFRAAACGSGRPFAVSTGSTFSYLLPSALARGRYVLDIQATDAAGNRTTLARGTSRLVFYVR